MSEHAQAIKKQQELAAKIKAGAKSRKFEIPGWYEKYPLYDYQMQGALWLYLTPKAILADQTGAGKSLTNSTGVLTPDGYTDIGSVEVGQEIVGVDGQNYKISGVFPQGEKEVIEMHFRDGTIIECCDEHLWTLQRHEVRRGKRDPETNKREYLGSSEHNHTETARFFEERLYAKNSGKKAGPRGKALWNLPQVDPIPFSTKDLPIEPYALGLLLGDGSFRSISTPRFSTADNELAKALESKLPNSTVTPVRGSKFDYNVCNVSKSITPVLKELDLWGKFSHEKHIPNDYLFASVDQRLALLQGLMDTDGSPSRAAAEFSTTSKELAQGLKHLVHSLGGVCPLKSRQTSYTYKGKKKLGRVSYRLNAKLGMPMFRLKRKLDKQSPYKSARRALVDVVRTGRLEQMTCISVTSPDKLFLVDNFTPTHNTIQTLGLLSILKDRDQLNSKKRAIIIVPASSVYGSWQSDGFEKFHVKLDYAIGRGKPAERRAIYDDDSWELLLTNYETVRRDIDHLVKLDFAHVIMDESDYIKNHATLTAKAVKRLTLNADRVVAISATPIQNTLLDLHSILEALGLKKVFGSKTAFDRRYHEHKIRQIYTKKGTIYKKEVIGFKNTIELKAKLDPYFLRRTYNDIDVKIPEMKSQVKWIEMTTEQKQLYAEVQTGFAQLSPNSPKKEIRSAFLRLRQVCTSTATIGADQDHSGKLDWLVKTLESDWKDNKVVVYSNWKASIHALGARLDAAGIKYVTMTGDENNQEIREKRRKQFWDDDDTRVLIGTTAIEKSLNLQVANIQVNLDMLYNPSRHQQLAGRIHRVGSEHSHAWVFSLMTKNTVEEGVMRMLQQKQAISDHIWDDDSEIFEKLTSTELLKLIRS